MKQPPIAVRYGSRYASSTTTPGPPVCPLCGAPVSSSRATYCSMACKQLAYRRRHQPRAAPDPGALRQHLQRERQLVAHTIYECPTCEERFVGQRRCPECQLFCRALGVGGECPECEQPILLADLLGDEAAANY
jgi:hypothetical protein